jgi:hypothetical protein
LAKFNFTKAFEEIGKQFVKGLKDRIIHQKGLDGAGYPPPTPATLEIRKARTGKGGSKLKSSGSTKRMHVTGDTANQAFSYLAKPNGVSIFALSFMHREGGITYREIIQDNGKGLGGTNPNIKESNKPLLFPAKPDDISLMTKEMRLAKNLIADEASKQFKEMAKTNLKIMVQVG